MFYFSFFFFRPPTGAPLVMVLDGRLMPLLMSIKISTSSTRKKCVHCLWIDRAEKRGRRLFLFAAQSTASGSDTVRTFTKIHKIWCTYSTFHTFTQYTFKDFVSKLTESKACCTVGLRGLCIQ